ncbi:hypothetical protein QTO34_019958 [Cnephaeus nilssonii]|uniref:Calponin-homology (CH) domain-containing protein n=1 Tax=Cnephaeus nilssonii TaxID=3371016 RepID=A0AA40HXQ8_CNENI|nr:hypothetical protein QTO34_019958 [Eptesicus nilssonii]
MVSGFLFDNCCCPFEIAEQEDTQKRTFTCWINSQLAKHTPPSVISDLFTDIQRGHVLLDLLEVLSGQQLPRDKGSNTFQCRLNIEHALTFLKSRSIKLINIHVADIIEGNPSIILGLIWIIILHFHIEELAQTLSCNPSQPSLDDVSVAESSPTSSPPAKKCSKAQKRWQMSAKKALLLWAQEQCATSESVSVTDFKSSWRNGMAFFGRHSCLATRPHRHEECEAEIQQRQSERGLQNCRTRIKNPPIVGTRSDSVAYLADVDVVDPDEKSIMTYVAQFLQYSKDAPGTADKAPGTMKDVMVWLTQQEKKLQKMLKDSENETYCKKYESLLSFLESFSEGKKPVLDILSMKGNLDELNEDQLQLRKAWDGLNYRVVLLIKANMQIVLTECRQSSWSLTKISMWKTKLNDDLPSPLHQIEAWLREVEGLTDADLPTSHDYYEAIALMEEKMALFKNLMDKCDCHSKTLLAFENRDEKQLPLVPAYKLEEMKRRINNISGRKFIPLLEFHYYKCSVLGLLDEVKSKLKAWNIKYGSRESVELLLEDWHKFIEEKDFLAQLESSFQKCEEIHKNLGGEYQNVSEQYTMMEHNISVCRKSIDNVRSTLQKVLACWTTYTEKLRFLKACFEETKKEQITEVPSETLSQWNLEHTTLNEVGNFLIQVSNDEFGSSISKELRRLNKRWRKFVTKTQLEMKLPLIKKQEQPVHDNSENMQPSKEEKPMVDSSTDTPLELPENHDQNIKAGEEHEKENEEFTGQLKVAEEVEKLIGEVETWEAETKSVLDLLRHKDDVDTSMEESLQINMVKLGAMLKNSADVSPDLSARMKVEESLKELESYITRAEQLLGQRESRSGLISKYKEALLIFNTKSLAKYLKAVEELKNNVTEDVKLSLEEKSRDVCAKWQSLHHELSLYIQQLKIDIEKGKISDTISRLEKQVNKEKKLIRRGRTKGLIKEHEACFSEEGSLHQLDHHMEVLRELCEELTSQKSQQEVRRVLRDYEQKIERLRKCASEIHATLQPLLEARRKTRGPRTHLRMEEGMATVRRHLQTQIISHQLRSQQEHVGELLHTKEKAVGSIKNLSLASELKPEQEEKDHNTSISSLRDRYDTHTETLELHLQNNKVRITSDFPSDGERSSACLQDKLEDLQVLKNETDACWKEFEITSLQLEELESDIKKPFIIKARDKLKEKEREFQMTLNTRMESLENALQLVVPVEKASLLLCGSDLLLLHDVAIEDFHFTDADGIYQNLKDIQDSIAKQIDICNNLEQLGNFALKELHPLDFRATQTIILKHRSQLEETNLRIQRSRDALRALEDFLASLKTAALPGGLVTDPSASGRVYKFVDTLNMGCKRKIGVPLTEVTKTEIVRKKSLIRLDKDLDDYEKEKKHLQEMASSLPQFKDGREKALNQQCQNTALLWESTKASVTEW